MMVSSVIIKLNLSKEFNLDALMFQFVAWSLECNINLHTSEEIQTEDTDAEISIKALRQKGKYTKDDHDYKKPETEINRPWWNDEVKARRLHQQLRLAQKKLQEKKDE